MADPPRSTAALTKRFATVEGRRMAYHETGDGAPVLFLHGNPTSSYLWRNVIPHLSDRYRCLAPDLIGMGDSAKLDDPGPATYRFVEHRRHLDGLLEQLDLGDGVTLVLHDWGSALGFDWANRHRSRVAAIAYMEAIVRPLAWSEWLPESTRVFQGFRSEAGREMVLERNIFVERVLPGSVLRSLSEEELAEYRRPFPTPTDRWPTLTWPREIPLDGDPPDVTRIVADYAAWLPDAPFPKLFINAEPGAILIGAQREFCRTWTNQQEVTVPGGHFMQEDSPEAIGQALAAWLPG
jgi:haloalkane dehalogenase